MDVAGTLCAHCTTTRGTINNLPTEILQKVFSYLDCEDLISVSKVCSVWNSAVNFVGLWNDVQWTIPEISELNQIEEILKYVPTVRNIRFKMYADNNFRNTVVKKILEHCQDIRSLDLGHRFFMVSDVFQSIIDKFPNIVELKLGYLKTDDRDILNMLQSCLNLKILEFNAMYCPQISLHPIAIWCPELTHLNIKMPGVVFDFPNFLTAKKDKLQSLVFYAPDDNAYTIPLGECKNLEHVGNTFTMQVPPTKEVFDSIASLPKLSRLELYSFRSIPSDMLRNFFYGMSSRNVVELSLGSPLNVSDEVATAIQTCCPLIKRLCLKTCNGPLSCEPPPFVRLFQLPNLEHLELPYFRYYECWFSQLLKCQKLRHLKLKRCDLLESHHALDLLTNLKLSCLDLSQCSGLNNSFLKNFPTVVSLKQLDITWCKFSIHMVEQLKRQHPSIAINWCHTSSRF